MYYTYIYKLHALVDESKIVIVFSIKSSLNKQSKTVMLEEINTKKLSLKNVAEYRKKLTFYALIWSCSV